MDVAVNRTNDLGRFNLSKCRNAGLAACDTEWVCFIDADVVVADDFAARILPALDGGALHLFANFPGRSDLTGTCVVARRHAEAIGGYDEVFDAWGGRDRDFYMRLKLAGLKVTTLPTAFIETIIAHPDELRTTFYPGKDMMLSQSISALYRLAKYNLMVHGGAHVLTLKDRQHLYAKAEEVVRRARQASNRTAQLMLELPVDGQFAAGAGRTRQTLTIEIETSRLK